MNQVVILSSCLIAVATALAFVWGLPYLDRLTARQVAELKSRMIALGIEHDSITRYLRLWVVLMVLIGAVLGPFMPPVALALVCIVYVLPRIILGVVVRRRSFLLRDQIVEASISLANATRAGMSLSQGIELVGKEAPRPLALEFQRITRDFEHGKPLPEALKDTRNRLNIDSFTLFSTAILVCLEQGGKVTEALERISNSLQEHQRLERKLEAETAGGRRVVVLLCFFPVGFLAFYAVAFREGASLLFFTFGGQCVLLVVMGLVYLGVQWCRKIISIEI